MSFTNKIVHWTKHSITTIYVEDTSVVEPYFLSTCPVIRVKYNILRFLVARKKIKSPNDFLKYLICYCSFSFPNVVSVLFIYGGILYCVTFIVNLMIRHEVQTWGGMTLRGTSRQQKPVPETKRIIAYAVLYW